MDNLNLCLIIFLACALAELVDNALSATAKNTGLREIEIRVVGFVCFFFCLF